MKYEPSSLLSEDIQIAAAAYLGGEFACFMTHERAVLIGTVDISDTDTGIYTPTPGASIKAAGADLQMVALRPILSDVALEILFAGMDDTGTPVSMNGTATFEPPARAENQSFNFARHFAKDVVPAVVGKKFTAITSLTSVTGGGKNQKIGIYQLPEAADYSLILATTDVNFNTKSRKAIGIDAGMEADYWIKRGKTQAGELSIGSKLQGFAEGMARFDGAKATCMLVGIKDGELTGDRLVFTDYVCSLSPKLPDGEGEAMAEATGKYKEALFFIAP
ncbi:MAG: hypothetical protein ACTHLW_00990 [Verrucomicrobiota bacterium]